MARISPPALLLAALTAATVTLAAGCGADRPRAAGASTGLSGEGVHPELRSLGDLAAPGREQLDSGVGVYPILTDAGRLVFPDSNAMRRARRFAASRRGLVAFAVADERGGVSGLNVDRPFRSASLTKAMLLVAFLRKVDATGRSPSRSDAVSLGYMIRVSDNASADRIYARVGDGALRDLARHAGMLRFAISGDWPNATMTAADQARLFISLDRLVPARFLGLARNLLETVAPFHTWGIPTAARPRWRAYFKGGWRPGSGGDLVHQAALLESGGRRLAIAVLTKSNPDMVYGERTIRGVAARLSAGGDAASVTTLPITLAPPRLLELEQVPGGA